LQALREETGAELAESLGQAIGAARSDLLLIAPADYRPGSGWLEALALHLRASGREAVLVGQGGGFLKRAPFALLIGRAKAGALAQPGLQRLRRELRHAPRIG
jgi:cellulose synthase/poly-beta-1,6-N-acetylglucosamine synthase-like glycosyltransferase